PSSSQIHNFMANGGDKTVRRLREDGGNGGDGGCL
ncbi:hypothetical protein A2U01_0113834, partial [Trifolium medium]|nr:hypothetical protein [Trifolium medium]